MGLAHVEGETVRRPVLGRGFGFHARHEVVGGKGLDHVIVGIKFQPCLPQCLSGESWRAVLPEGAPANVPTGTRVRVREMKGLTLEVEPVVDDRPGPSKVGEI